jgi:hypothetical protein
MYNALYIFSLTFALTFAQDARQIHLQTHGTMYGLVPDCSQAELSYGSRTEAVVTFDDQTLESVRERIVVIQSLVSKLLSHVIVRP